MANHAAKRLQIRANTREALDDLTRRPDSAATVSVARACDPGRSRRPLECRDFTARGYRAAECYRDSPSIRRTRIMLGQSQECRFPKNQQEHHVPVQVLRVAPPGTSENVASVAASSERSGPAATSVSCLSARPNQERAADRESCR
jgi:hypothetical protein